MGDGGVIRYSDDNGLNWTTPEPNVHLDLDDIIWEPGSARFVAVGGYRFESGIVLTSFDGANWQRRTLTNPPVVTVRDQMGRGPFEP